MRNQITFLLASIVVCSLGCSAMKTEKRTTHCDACWQEEKQRSAEEAEAEINSERPYPDPVMTVDYPSPIAQENSRAKQPAQLQATTSSDAQPLRRLENRINGRPTTDLSNATVELRDLERLLGNQPNTQPNFAAPPVIGSRLPQQEITATEHAFRLFKENQDLKATREALIGENRDLRQKLANASQLLARMDKAVTAAQTELNSAEIQRLELKSRISALEAESKRIELRNSRLLESIQDELDDVLVREISSTE